MNELIQLSKTVIDIGFKKEYKFFQISDAHMACIDENSSEADLNEYRRSHEQWDDLKIHYAERFGEYYDDRYQVEPYVLFEALTKHALEFGADALILSGDIMDRVSESNIRYLKRFKENYPIPVIYCPGNHARTDEFGVHRKMYERFEGLIDNPAFNVFDYDEFEIVAVDNGTKEITREQLDLMQAEIDKNKKILLLIHAPLKLGEFGEEVAKNVNHYFVMGSQYDSDEAREFVELIRANDTHFIGVLAGHIHASVEYNITDNLKQYTTSSALIGYGREITIK
ncbi:MAG: metallophosphoesterase [Clostridia bacterium]|nr:metallophosphoesterase [Clostridia bacterium]